MPSEELIRRLRHVARIVGPQSAAAKALDEYHRRSAAGENVTIYEQQRSLIVGPVETPDAG